MVDFDKFEKNVKDNYGNQEFPFDEQNWEKAAKLIDASRKGKNRGGIILWSATALLVTSGLVYYFGFSDSSSALKNNDIAINQTIPSTNEAGNNNTVVPDNNAATENASVTENTSPDANSNISNATTNTEHNSNTTVLDVKTASKTKVTVNNPAVSENASASNPESTSGNSTASTESKAEPKTTSPSANNNVSESSANNPSNTNSSPKKSTPVKSSVKSATPPVLGNNNSVAQNTTRPVSANTTPSENGNTNREGDIKNDNNSVSPVKDNVTVVDSNSAIVEASVKPTESVVVDSVPAVRKSRADSLAAMLPKGDGVSYATNVKEKHNAKNIFYMEAGTTYLFGWNGSGKNEAGGFNLLAGINFQHYFTGSIAAQIGVQYSTISNLTNTTHTISTVNYDLGMEQDVTSIRYQKLHYLVAPVKVTFNAGDKNSIGVGANIGYLLNSDSKKEKYKTYSSDPNATKSNFTSTKESGYVQGFNPLDIQVGVSYRRKIYKGLSANAEFFYGLTDTKNNDFFKSDYFDRNMGFKVSLCYDLFKK